MSNRSSARSSVATEMATPKNSGAILQRQCDCGTHTPGGGECTACSRKKLQRKATNEATDFEAPESVHDVLNSAGQPLDRETRAYLEPRFGRDFSSVRVHSDASAAQSAHAVGALAYTVGQNIVFGAGQYAPGSLTGRRLLAHELAHTVQQQASSNTLAPRLEVGAVDTAAEREADLVAERVTAGERAPNINAAAMPTLQRQPDPSASEDRAEPDFSSPQQRGGRARAAFIDAGKRGEDQVRIAVTRYLCDCSARDVTRTSASARLQPNPGVTLEFCRGSVTGRVTGDVVPSSFSTGRATVRAEVNKAPEGGTGVRVGVEGEVRNTGSEPEAGGRADVRVKPPGGPEIGVSGDIFRGTQTGQTNTSINAGVDVNVPGVGPVRITGGVTNPQDSNRIGGQIGIGGNLPGQTVDNKTCRECRCPIVYECLEDVPPRDYKEPVTYDVEDRGRLRYYYQLDTDKDTPDSVLRGESTRMLDEVARRVAAGARIVSITGYASPEDNREKPTPNQELSLSRGKRLRSLLASRLGDAKLPEASAGGELFGRVATIAPGSRLADAILSVGFGDPDDVTAFLIGNDIPNDKLSDQFLQLLERVTEPADRLRLFGIDSASAAAPRLLAAIEQYVRSRGKGRRPWENLFGYLRYATVELSTMRKETRQEDRRTSGSLTPMSDAQCKPYAKQAEDAGKFGPAQPEPANESQCPRGDTHNAERFAKKCNYD